MRTGEELIELPFRSINADDAVTRLMAERGETLADVEWFTDGAGTRAADFEHAIMRTKRHVYTVVSDWWDGGIESGSGLYCKVFVAKVEDGHGHKI